MDAMYRLVLCSLALATPALAAPKKIKAEMLCGTMSAAKEVKPLSGKTGKLTDNVACAIHMSDPKEEPHMGTLKTVRHTIDAATGKRKDVPGASFTTDFGPGSDRANLELVMESGTDAFKPCEDFDIIGTISDDLGVYFTKTIKVVQTCPKPAALKASVSCDFEPKTGKHVVISTRKAERPYPLESVNCVLTTTDTRLSAGATVRGEAQWTEWKDDGTSKPRKESVSGQMFADGNKLGVGMSFDTAYFPNCQDVAIVFTVELGDATIFTQKVQTTLTCGE